DTEYDVDIIGSSPKRLEVFLQGRVAAAMLTPPASDKALAAGGVLLANSEEYVPNWPLTCGWTLRRTVISHRELVVRFIRAWVVASDWLLRAENRESTLQLMMEKEGLNRASAEEAYRKVVPTRVTNPT